MIYDNRPVFDHFRYVNDNLLAGIMEGKELGKDGEFYFYLKRNPLWTLYVLGIGLEFLHLDL